MPTPYELAMVALKIAQIEAIDTLRCAIYAKDDPDFRADFDGTAMGGDLFEAAWDTMNLAEQFVRNEGCTDAEAAEWAKEREAEEKIP